MFSPDGKLAKIMGNIFDILIIGIIWFITSLPIVTIGLTTTAAYYTMSKVVRHKTGYLFKEYFHALRVNLKGAVLPSLVFLISYAVLVVDIIYVWNERGSLNDSLFIVLVGVAFVITSVFIYYMPFLSRFDKRTGEILKMSAFASFRFLPVTIGIMAVFALSLAGIYLMPWLIVVLPGFFFYFLTFPMEFVMKKFMKKPEEGSPEAEIWYYK